MEIKPIPVVPVPKQHQLTISDEELIIIKNALDELYINNNDNVAWNLYQQLYRYYASISDER